MESSWNVGSLKIQFLKVRGYWGSVGSHFWVTAVLQKHSLGRKLNVEWVASMPNALGLILSTKT